MFNNNFEYKVHNKEVDADGNYLILDLTIQTKRITLCNIYGPNTDSPAFFNKISDIITVFSNANIIICGDFNLVQDIHLDYFNYVNINNPKARDRVLQIKEEIGLIDPFRENNFAVKRYTWRKRNPLKQARLDFFLISENFSSDIKSCDIDSSYRSDHSPIKLCLKFDNFVKGKGLWKFNNSLLYDIEYVKQINKKINEVISQYALPIYNFDNLDNIPIDSLQLTINDQLFLDVLLMEIRGKTISYASHKKKIQNQAENNLRFEISLLENQTNDTNNNELETKKQELEKIRISKIKGSMVRSRALWISEGEKPSKYFFGLESRNYVNKIISKVENCNGDIITDQGKILDETKNFYANLYSEKITLDEFDFREEFKNYDIPKLTFEESEKLEGLISLDEATRALHSMKNNKSPGSDGFSTEFFKMFWNKLGYFVIRSLNFGYLHGELSSTQKEGIVTCIPKENKPKQFLKNWRPITLLNTIYKIGSTAIANRMKTVLDKLISKEQTGFMTGRYIGENTRLIYDLLQYTENKNIPGLLLFIDFEKAFDSVSWKFINKVLNFFNFGNSFQQWINTLYSNIKSRVVMGGHLSNYFIPKRGCRQGDPISPYIFILCAEILSIKIKNEPKIRGIKVDRFEFKISQYADDTSIILDGKEESLNTALKTLKWFENISGLKINFDKTQVIWIGSKKYSKDKLCKQWGLQWGKHDFKLLGIDFDVDLDSLCEINYKNKMNKIKSILKCWEKRNITQIGRIVIIKSLIISQFNHLFISIPNPSHNILKELNHSIFKFIWNNKNDKVKREVMTLDFDDGGLNMIDLKTYIHSLKLTWIRRILNTEGIWQNLLLQQFNLNNIINYGVEYLNIIISKQSNKFWKDALMAWQEMQKKENLYLKNLELTPLWYNNNIKIDNKYVNYKHWQEKNIFNINDIIKNDGNF